MPRGDKFWKWSLVLYQFINERMFRIILECADLHLFHSLNGCWYQQPRNWVGIHEWIPFSVRLSKYKLHKTSIKGVCNIYGVISIPSFIISEFLLYYYCYWGSENPVVEPLPTYVRSFTHTHRRRRRHPPAAWCCHRSIEYHDIYASTCAVTNAHTRIAQENNHKMRWFVKIWNEWISFSLSFFLCAVCTFWSPTSYVTVRAAVAFWRAVHFSLPFFLQSWKVGNTMWIEDVVRGKKLTRPKKITVIITTILICNNNEKATQNACLWIMCVRCGIRYSYSWHAVRLILFIRLLFLCPRLPALISLLFYFCSSSLLSSGKPMQKIAEEKYKSRRKSILRLCETKWKKVITRSVSKQSCGKRRQKCTRSVREGVRGGGLWHNPIHWKSS